MELLRELIPSLARIGFIGSTLDQNGPVFADQSRRAAIGNGLQLVIRMVADEQAFDAAFAQFSAAEVQAVIAQPIFLSQRRALTAASEKVGIPVVSDHPEFAVDGALFALGSDMALQSLGSADYVRRILKGARPGDLPVQQATNTTLWLNRGVAGRYGLTVSPSILAGVTGIVD